VSEFELLALLAVAVSVAALARRYGWPMPLVLVGVGLAVSFVPVVPHYAIDPHLLLDLILPPLLYSAALSSSYTDLRRSLNSISRLGIGLVLVSAAAVALVAVWLVPNLPFAAALLLGAVVAPPDAVAAAAVGRRLHLPRRVMTLLTGESLINDATSLTLYKVALAGVATGTWSFGQGLRVFAVAVLIGVSAGLAIGWGVHVARLHLDDPVVASAIGLATPFAAYWIAEDLGGSGVLAVVAAGLYLGHSAPEAGYATRLYEEPLWSTFDLILESFTFALIGLQLKWVIAEVQRAPDQGMGRAVLAAAAVLAVAIAVRPLYVFATTRFDHLRFRGSHRPVHDDLTRRESGVVSWAGMRGVVTLAAAAGIPLIAAGAGFPHRATLQFIAYAVAIGTLLLQGMTLPWVIRRAGIGSADDDARDAAQEATLRLATTRAASAAIEQRESTLAAQLGEEQAASIIRKLSRGVLEGGAAAAALLDPSRTEGAPAPLSAESGRRILRFRREIVAAQRGVLMRSRDAGEVDEVVMRRMLRELDLEEESMSASWLDRI
jgi:CPA1 family monovalent cation:H+ antiporter